MARGQAEAADYQRRTTNAIGKGQQGQADTLESKLLPGYESLMSTGYLSPEEENAARVSEMGTAEAPFATAKFEAANRAGATRNASDLTAQQDQLALEQGQVSTEAAARLQEEKMQNQLAGMYGIGQEEAGNRREAEAMYGLGPATLQARAAGPGWAQGFRDVYGAISGGAANAARAAGGG